MQYKWTYKNKNYQENEVLNSMKKDEINLTGCLKEIDDYQFNKIRSGLIQDKTPPPSKVTKKGSSHKKK